ncbi:3-hydroxyacyl-CoA dehydrogenase [Xylophilus sp. GOD-11R]|uniref:3-hydroxyacyl-CoA dehydrogenase n=1 Tax=Xylophilus sp. GOD-11R TaxID=3089814 RepID=UPI00298BEA25|nr:3-hydroxyacyl-CoA dehydrogenase [Xylophilus sp. GOD-11R]WPB55749.1 3-hydroxyacyl-CoA dehydrogenase [Xylophilus sp. GOD-11R]
MTLAAPASPIHRVAAVIGGGSIGVAFALVLARAGWQVRVQDPSAERRRLVPAELRERCDMLLQRGLLNEPVDALLARVETVDSVEVAAAGIALAIECAPERADVKKQVFTALDTFAPADAVLCSASSALPASAYCAELPGRGRCMVAHPGNPPYLIPVIELVPADFTDADALVRCRAIFASVGMKPVIVRKEIEGFLFNRLQGAVLREAYCLVRDGVASVEDIDTVMRDGLGLRWSFIGPFETVDLNTRGGIESHAAKMGPAYERMGASRGQHDPWTPELVGKVATQRRELLPLEQWEQRVQWRDEQLMAMAQFRQEKSDKPAEG